MKTSDRWVLAQWVLVGLLGLSLFAPRSAWLTWARIPGVVLAALGGLVAGSAVLSYVRANRSVFRVSPDPDTSSQMVRSGIYGVVRHPTYAGVIVAAWGLALFSGSTSSLLVAGVISMFFYMKSRYEDTLLVRTFPGYDAYRERVGRFFPVVRFK